MKIIKILNNNMVLVKTDEDKEQICQGKGIGFGKKAGATIDDGQVERRFVLSDTKERTNFTSLFAEISDEYFAIADQTLQFARSELNIKVPDKVLLPLCDHMAGSMDRYRKGIILNNPMLWDTKRVYPSEFAAGCYALKLLEEKFGVRMKEDEAAFLAHHFVASSLDHMSDFSADDMTKLIAEIIGMVEASFQIDLNENDWDYQRFLTHLKFFAQRVISRKVMDTPADTELYDELSERYMHVNNCVNRIADHILINYHYDINTDEKMYLLIHVRRVTKKYLKK